MGIIPECVIQSPSPGKEAVGSVIPVGWTCYYPGNGTKHPAASKCLEREYQFWIKSDRPTGWNLVRGTHKYNFTNMRMECQCESRFPRTCILSRWAFINKKWVLQLA